jgi:hypothetical protein
MPGISDLSGFDLLLFPEFLWQKSVTVLTENNQN